MTRRDSRPPSHVRWHIHQHVVHITETRAATDVAHLWHRIAVQHRALVAELRAATSAEVAELLDAPSPHPLPTEPDPLAPSVSEGGLPTVAESTMADPNTNGHRFPRGPLW